MKDCHNESYGVIWGQEVSHLFFVFVDVFCFDEHVSFLICYLLHSVPTHGKDRLSEYITSSFIHVSGRAYRFFNGPIAISFRKNHFAVVHFEIWNTNVHHVHQVFAASTTYEKQLRIEKTRLSHQVWSHGGSTLKKKDIKRPFFPPCRN